MRTQMIGSESYMFKWFDHIPSDGSFDSGMDDFPRPPGTQYHVDAQCWMYELTKFMYEASVQFQDASAEGYRIKMELIKKNLEFFRDPVQNIYLDIIVNSNGSHSFSPFIGYGSILPIAFGMVDKKTVQFTKTLSLMTNTSMLNTGHGLSSIQRSSPEYLRTKDAYWRGPIWINMNYLALKGLKLFYPYESRKIYK